MNPMEIGTQLVSLCNAGKDEEAVNQFYSPAVVSIEGHGSDDAQARIEGLDAVREKSAWWYDNHTVHNLSASGPYLGLAADQFLVRFEMDITPKNGERMQMDEVGIYRVADGKIVEEAFYYRMS